MQGIGGGVQKLLECKQDAQRRGGLVAARLTMSAVLLSHGIAQDLHVFLVGDRQLRPCCQPVFYLGHRWILTTPGAAGQVLAKGSGTAIIFLPLLT